MSNVQSKVTARVLKLQLAAENIDTAPITKMLEQVTSEIRRNARNGTRVQAVRVGNKDRLIIRGSRAHKQAARNRIKELLPGVKQQIKDSILARDKL